MDERRGNTDAVRQSQLKATAYNDLGRISLKEGTDKSARRVVVQLENKMELNKAISYVDGIVIAKSSIAHIKS